MKTEIKHRSKVVCGASHHTLLFSSVSHNLHSSIPVPTSLPMDRAQLLLFGLPLFLFCSDLFSLFTPPPPPPPHHHHHHHRPPHHHDHPPHHQDHPPHHHHHHSQHVTIEFPAEVIFFVKIPSLSLFQCPINVSLLFLFSQKTTSSIANAGLGNTVNINFCTSCSYRYLLLVLWCCCFLTLMVFLYREKSCKKGKGF